MRVGWRIAIAFVLAGVFTAIAFLAFLQVSLPESNFVSSFGTANGLESFIRSVRTNIEFIPQGRTLEIAQRYQLLFIAAIAGVGVVRGLWRQRSVGTTHVSPAHDIRFKENVFHFLNLSIVFAAIIVAYDMFSWRDYRIIAPHLLVSLLLLVAFRRWRLVMLVIIVGTLTFPKFRESYPVDSFTYPPERIAAFAESIEGALAYEPEQNNAWCNTLLLHGSHLLGPALTAIPAGIGLSVLRAVDTMPDTLKSRYVLIDDQTYAVFAETLDAMPLEPLAQTELGTLYLNGNADCE
ncbi:MAG: hypothetical protein H7175_25180 [Burkholderiales bacterium]|nr:hypothetical protein [Anaerolineae bacterium]